MKKEIYYYDDLINNQIVIGTRGVSEYRVDRDAFIQEVMRLRAQPEEYLRIAIKITQYVDFEEVKPNNLLLGLRKHGGKTKQTKEYSVYDQL